MLEACAILIEGWHRVRNLLIGLDVLINAVIGLVGGGQPYQTVSCRVGLSIASGGWASRVPWPAWWRAHCAAAVYTTVV